MRYLTVLLLLLLAACGDSGMTRNFGVSRDSAPETMASTQMPLSVPPNLSDRPRRPGVLAPMQGNTASDDRTASLSPGQDALLDSSGPAPSTDIRTRIDQNSGLVYPPPQFVDSLMTWTPPPGYTSVVTHASKGWFSGGIFDWF